MARTDSVPVRFHTCGAACPAPVDGREPVHPERGPPGESGWTARGTRARRAVDGAVRRRVVRLPLGDCSRPPGRGDAGLGDDWDGLFDGHDPGGTGAVEPAPARPAAHALGFDEGGIDDDPLERAILQLAGESEAETVPPARPPGDMPSDAGTWARDAERMARLRASGTPPSDQDTASPPVAPGFPAFGASLEAESPSEAEAPVVSDPLGSALARVALLAVRQPPSDTRERWAGHSVLPADEPPSPATAAAPSVSASGDEPSVIAGAPGLAAGVLRRRRPTRPSRSLDAVVESPTVELVEPQDAIPGPPSDAGRPPREPLAGAGVLPAAREPLRGAGVVRRRRAATGSPAVVGARPDDTDQK